MLALEILLWMLVAVLGVAFLVVIVGLIVGAVGMVDKARKDRRDESIFDGKGDGR